MNRATFQQVFGSEAHLIQLELLLDYLETCDSSHFLNWLRSQGVEAPAAPAPTTPAAPMLLGANMAPAPLGEPVDQEPPSATSAQTYSFFGRKLDDSWLNGFQSLTGQQSGDGTQSYHMEVTLSAEWWAWARAVLSQTIPVANVEPDCGLIAGFKVQYSDGAIAGIAICNSPTGPWVDALLRVPDNAPETVDNVSLAPRKDLQALFSFEPQGLAVHTLQLR